MSLFGGRDVGGPITFKPGSARNFEARFEGDRTETKLIRCESHRHRRDIAVLPIRLGTPDLSSS